MAQKHLAVMPKVKRQAKKEHESMVQEMYEQGKMGMKKPAPKTVTRNPAKGKKMAKKGMKGKGY